MKILLLGANGQLGWELSRSLAPLGELKSCDRQEVDFENLDGLRSTIREYAPSVVVNAAGYTAVDKAESEPEKADRINATAVGLLASEAKRLDAWLVHYSTDYIFDGTKPAPYVETDRPAPLNVYGHSKLDGEKAIQKSLCRHLIFRASWVYASRGSNFIRTVLRLAAGQEEIKMIADQIGAPTSAELMADVSALALYRVTTGSTPGEKLSGTYNLAASGETNWHQYARLIIRTALNCGVLLKAHPDGVMAILSSGYPSPARRPLNSRLDTKKLRNTFGLSLPSWDEGVIRMLNEIVYLKNMKRSAV